MSVKVTKEDVVKTFATDSGQKVFAFLKEIVKYDESSFIPDAVRAAYVAGRRSVLCDIIKLMEEK